MRSTMRLTFLVSLTLAATACARPVVLASPSSCASLIPAEWEKGVDGAPEPSPAEPAPATPEGRYTQAIAELKKWVGFGVDESNRREQANGRTRDAIGILRRCEQRDAEAVRKSRPRFLGVI